MNKESIIHLSNLEDSYALSKNEAVIRIRAAKGDLEAVTLFFIDFYRQIFHDYHEYERSEMQWVASDGRYDCFETVIPHEVQVLSYYFRLQNPEGIVCYGNGIFFDENQLETDKCFSMPAIQAEDMFELPEWTREAIIYQIFPDSFYAGDGADIDGWYRGPRESTDHLGGTLQGVIDKLDYIQSLGANVVYLTPIFESPANHKYHTTDYYKIDPRFGTKEKFAELVDLAHTRGMRVLLDGVFHSTGTQFFAFQDVLEKGPDSDYWDWFLVDGYPIQTDYPINYRSWGKLPELPNLNRSNPEVIEYLLDVMVYWVKVLDIDGWRLDTVDDMSHTFLREARRRMQTVKKDCIIVGELWYDARPWLKGDTLDSVMNYLFTRNVVAFFGKKTATPTMLSHGLGWIRGRYPYQAWNRLWNLLSSHDIVRFLSQADDDVEGMKLAVLFQFTYPGTPFIYAGDELGMTGHSLICRCGLLWDESRQDSDLLAHYRMAGRLRKENPALFNGDFEEIIVSDERGLYGFARRTEHEEILVVFNVGHTDQNIEAPVGSYDLLKESQVVGPTISIRPQSATLLRRKL